MSRLTGCVLPAFSLLVLLGVASAQEFAGDLKKQNKGKGKRDISSFDGDIPKQKKDKGDDEYARMAKLIEKSYKKSETEREKVIKELVKLDPGEELTNDFGEWFKRVDSGGAWDRARVSSMGLAEIHDRISDRLQLPGTTISRADFLRYAQKYWRQEDSPPWKVGKEWDLGDEADKLFKQLDRDRDDYLTDNEIPAALRSDMAQWDTSRDGRIDLQEYRAYFPRRFDYLHRNFLDGINPSPPSLVIPEKELDERPKVFRVGKLPEGLPSWFVRLDIDQDGQIALYEWRRAGLPVEEFPKLDLDDDGLLVPEELLKLLKSTGKGGIRPFAYLRDNPVLSENKGTRISSHAAK